MGGYRCCRRGRRTGGSFSPVGSQRFAWPTGRWLALGRAGNTMSPAEIDAVVVNLIDRITGRMRAAGHTGRTVLRGWPVCSRGVGAPIRRKNLAKQTQESRKSSPLTYGPTSD
jgi:phage tail tape-measure protein